MWPRYLSQMHDIHFYTLSFFYDIDQTMNALVLIKHSIDMVVVTIRIYFTNETVEM